MILLKRFKINYKNSLKYKIIGLFFSIVLSLVLFFEVFSITSVKNYFYDNMSGILYNQVRYNAEVYYSNLSEYDLQDVIINDRDQFYRNDLSRIQLLDNSGLLIYDSIATDEIGKVVKTRDVKEASSGKGSVFVSKSKDRKHNVMSVSYPLINQVNQVGIIRLTTRLDKVDKLVNRQAMIYLLVGFIMIFLATVVSIIVANSITSPLKELKNVASKISDGQYSTKANEESDGEIGELAKTMNMMSDSILEKDRLKNDFISSVSHELRTPLTSIKGWALTLQSPDMDSNITMEGLKIIEKESDRLSSMVEDLLDFSTLRSKRIQLIKERFNLVDTTDKILIQLQPKFKEREINSVVNYTDKEIFVTADIGRIKQVLINIIDNAIKFTDEGGSVFVDISDKEDSIVCSIIDTGIGIDESEINLVTEKFYKGSSSASHTGLGLSIVEEIVKSHGGQLSIKSTVGVGTNVTFTLPKEDVE